MTVELKIPLEPPFWVSNREKCAAYAKKRKHTLTHSHRGLWQIFELYTLWLSRMWPKKLETGVANDQRIVYAIPRNSFFAHKPKNFYQARAQTSFGMSNMPTRSACDIYRRFFQFGHFTKNSDAHGNVSKLYPEAHPSPRKKLGQVLKEQQTESRNTNMQFPNPSRSTNPWCPSIVTTERNLHSHKTTYHSLTLWSAFHK